MNKDDEKWNKKERPKKIKMKIRKIEYKRIVKLLSYLFVHKEEEEVEMKVELMEG